MKFLKSIKKLGWLALLPVLTGCGGSGGLALLGLGSLFSGGSSISTFLGGSGGTTLALLSESSGGGIPTLHNPEPASMILFGTGMAAMAYFKRRRLSFHS